MSKYVIDSATLTSIGDAVREKDGTTEAILVSDIATRIKAIPQEGGGGGADIPEEAFKITGSSQYRFAYGGWDWFLNQYGNQITTQDITTSCSYMFHCSKVENIPFDINCSLNNEINMDNMFNDCANLKDIPKIVGKVYTMKAFLSSCESLEELKEESVSGLVWDYIDTQTVRTYGARNSIFSYCIRLRKLPMSFLAHGNPVGSYGNSIYYSLFNCCYSLDEVIDLPIQHRNASWTNSAFYNSFKECYRLKDVIFETNEDGSPIVINGWSKQTIDLSKNVGYFYTKSYVSSYTNFTTDTEVKDDATYQALKDNPDWWTLDANYSRYNHDSAVRTINSLPDLSGGAGGNTIIFKQTSGANTDGGACGNLTAEEIAVATAKGWTVTLS